MRGSDHFSKLIVILLAFICCKGNDRSQLELVEIRGYIYDAIEDPIRNAKVELVETLYSPNLTDNNNGFKKYKSVLGSTLSSEDGSFNIAFESKSLGGLREIIVTKENFQASSIPITNQKEDIEKSIIIRIIRLDDTYKAEGTQILIDDPT